MFRLKDLIELIPQSIPLGDQDIEWQSLSIDSRTIKPGDLFLALKGERVDGHQFILSACQKGAIGIVMEKTFFSDHPSIADECKKPFLLVDNTLFAFQKWAHHYYSLYKPFSICITGSNGKTTTKEIINHILASKYHVLKSQGNYNNEIGVPLTLFGLTPYHDVMVVEMAAQRVGEIKNLTNIVKPDIAVITNVGEAHVGLFGCRDNIAKEKAEIILALKDKGTAVLNRDDSYFNYFRDCLSHHNELVSFGFHPEADLRASNIQQVKEKGISFDLLLPGGRTHRLLIPLLGQFNTYNVMAAIAVGMKMHVPLDEIFHGLSTFKSLKMHMECSEFHRGIILIKDYYNANPTATEEALMTVSDISKDGFKVAVLGDMLELGSEIQEYHRDIGRKAASLSYDMIIGFGEYGHDIQQGAQEQGMPVDKIFQFDVKDKEKLVNHLVRSVPDKSIVLIKGSRNMKMEDIVQYWQNKEKKGGKREHD